MSIRGEGKPNNAPPLSNKQVQRLLDQRPLDIKIPKNDLDLLITQNQAIGLILIGGQISPDEGANATATRKRMAHERVMKFQKTVKRLYDEGFTREDIIKDLCCKQNRFDAIMAFDVDPSTKIDGE